MTSIILQPVGVSDFIMKETKSLDRTTLFGLDRHLLNLVSTNRLSVEPCSFDPSVSNMVTEAHALRIKNLLDYDQYFNFTRPS